MSEAERSEAFDRLQQRVADALADYLAERQGGFMGHWILVGDYTATDGESSWLQVVSDDQRLAQTIQLIEWARLCSEDDVRAYLSRRREED